MTRLTNFECFTDTLLGASSDTFRFFLPDDLFFLLDDLFRLLELSSDDSEEELEELDEDDDDEEEDDEDQDDETDRRLFFDWESAGPGTKS